MTNFSSAQSARAALVDKAAQQFRQQYDLFGQINENMNGVLGVGSDSPRVSQWIKLVVVIVVVVIFIT